MKSVWVHFLSSFKHDLRVTADKFALHLNYEVR